MKKFLLFLLLTYSTCTHAQDIFKINEGWLDMTIWYKVSPTVRVGGDYGYRTVFENFSFHSFYARPTISWKPSDLYSFSFAVSDFYTHESEVVNLNELRFAQQGSLFWPKIGPIRFDHRLRFEERFFSINQAKENSSRMRYRLAANSPKYKMLGIKTFFYSAITWERFVNLGSSFENIFGDSERWEIVFGNKVSDKVKVGIHYIFQSVRTLDDTFELQENIFRLRIGYTIN